jgi:hypothetical protein
VTNVLVVGTPTKLIGRYHPTELGQMPPPAGHHRWSDESLLYVITYLGSPLHRDADLCLLIGLVIPLSRMWQPYR